MPGRPATWLACALLLGGCSLSPHYARPAVEAPVAAFKESGDW